MMARSSPRQPRDGFVLAVDQGTTNCKAVLLTVDSATPRAEASAPASISFPAPGRVEQEAEQLWAATLEAIKESLEKAESTKVVGLAISSQRESAVCWSRSTGRPLGPVIGWQDARTQAWCDALSSAEPSAREVVRRRTGLALDPMFSAPKFRASIDAALANGAELSDIAVGTVDSWLVWNLTGQHATDLGNASRTLLLDLHSLDWHDELLELFGVPRSCLPELRPSDGGFGKTSRGVGTLPIGTPVVAVLADSHAAMYYHGATRPGAAKATYGTGSSVMAPTPTASPGADGIATTLAWHVDGAPTYAREGNVLATGAALDWMARTLGVPEGEAGGRYLTHLAAGASDSGGVSFVPAFSGLGAPHWDRGATGVIVGVTAGTTREHLAMAALEAVAHQVVDVVEAMESDGSTPIDVIHADGGATASDLLMQVQADLLGRPVEKSDVPSASALGVGRLAAHALGCRPAPPPPGVRVDPRPIERDRARRSWVEAVARSRGMAIHSRQ